MKQSIKALPIKHFETLLEKGSVDLIDIFKRDIKVKLGKNTCCITLCYEGIEVASETIDIPFDYSINEKLIFNFIKIKTSKRVISSYDIRSSIFRIAKNLSKFPKIPLSVTEHIIRNPNKDISLEYWTDQDIRAYFRPYDDLIYFKKFEKGDLIAETRTPCYTDIDSSYKDDLEIRVYALKTHSRLVKAMDYLKNYC